MATAAPLLAAIPLEIAVEAPVLSKNQLSLGARCQWTKVIQQLPKRA